MIDLKYILKCKNGDASSFKFIYESTAPYVYTIVKNYIYDDEYRKDIMQEIYAAVFTSIHSFDETRGSFKPWLAKIAVVNCIAHLRKSSRVKFDFTLSKVDEMAEDDMLKLDELSQEEIEMLLTDMPSGYKTIFLMNVIDEFSHKEIAEILKISPETSRSQLMRGIQWIKKNITITASNKLAYGNE